MNNSDEHLQKSNIQQIFIHLLKQIPAITDLSLPEEKITYTMFHTINIIYFAK
jgi:hypothetical protein